MINLTTDNLVTFLNSRLKNVTIRKTSEESIQAASSINNIKKNSVVFLTQRRWGNFDLNLEMASCVITNSESVDIAMNIKGNFSVIEVENPRLAFLRVLEQFFKQPEISGIHPTAQIETSAKIAPSAAIGAFTYIGEDCSVDADTVISAGCTISGRTRIGKRCFIAPGVRIGQPGYGYERLEDGSLLHVPHVGGVLIGNGVQIGANTAIDRGTLDDTVIHDRVCIDNMCHISHNVIIEEDCAVIANAMIGGSARIGKRSWISPSCSIRDGISIVPDTTIGIGSVVSKPIEQPGVYVGSPAQTLDTFKIERAKLRSLISNGH